MTSSDVWHVALAVLASLGGGGAIVFGLSSWLGKVWATRLLESERAKYAEELERLRSNLEQANRLLQGEIEKTIFVSKVHFETEFKALAEIWRRVAEVRSSMASLRSPEVNEDKLNYALQVFRGAIAELITAVDQQFPFYPIDIFSPLEKLILIATDERDDVEISKDQFQEDWYRRGANRFLEYNAATKPVADLIRERISKLSVYGGGLGGRSDADRNPVNKSGD
jgi:hypothetical protein